MFPVFEVSKVVLNHLTIENIRIQLILNIAAIKLGRQNKVDRFQQGSLSGLIVTHDDVEMFVQWQFKRAKGFKSFDFDFLYVHK